MTALVFTLQPEQVCVAMDTLVVDADDKKPMQFQRKFLPLPEMNLLVAGTGCVDLINDWFSVVPLLNVADIDELNYLVPEKLRALASSCLFSFLSTTTVYHFGYSNEEGKYVGYAYRSENGYEPDRLEYGLGLKPVVPVVLPEKICLPAFLIEIILEQQRQDCLLPTENQVGIGGDVEFAVLSSGAIDLKTVHRFASYGAELQYIQQ